MQDAITGEFVKLVIKAVKRYSEKLKTVENAIQVVFKLNGEGENAYWIYKAGQPECEVKFNDLLGVKVDFSGRSMYVPPALNKILLQLNEDLELPPNSISVMLIKRTPEEKERIEKFLEDFVQEELIRQKLCLSNNEIFKENNPPEINSDFKICLYNNNTFLKGTYFTQIFSLL